MKCLRPTKFRNSGSFARCGQCRGCRVTRRTEWMTRLYLEFKYHKKMGAFVTLTYAPEYLPDGDKYSGGNLLKTDVQDFIKRFRYYLDGKGKLTYFAVGEYGDETQRAHYHLCMFGISPERIETLVEKAWKRKGKEMGWYTVADLREGGINRIRYTAKYTVKKMTSPKSYTDGRNPEFSLMSKVPPIGVSMLPIFKDYLRKNKLFPIAGLSLEQRHFMEKKFRKLLPWNGYFKTEGVNMILDKYTQKALFMMTYPDVAESMEDFISNEITYEYLKSLSDYDAINAYRSNVDEFIVLRNGERYEQIKKSEKSERLQRNKSLCNRTKTI